MADDGDSPSTEDHIRVIARLVRELIDATGAMELRQRGHNKSFADSDQKIVSLIQSDQKLLESESQSRMVTDFLLRALIGELVRSGVISGGSVASRFLAAIEKQHFLFHESVRAHARLLADEMSHPGFPDNVPPPRGHGPTLIVDNES